MTSSFYSELSTPPPSLDIQAPPPGAVFPSPSPTPISSPTTAQFDVFRYIRFYALGVIIPCGFAANTIAIGVFVRSRLYKTVPGLYFTCLALADNLTLFGEFLIWLNTRIAGEAMLLRFMHTNNVLCKLIYLIKYSGRAWSSWVTVSITIERFLCVTFPLRAARWSSRLKTKLAVLSMFVFAFSLGMVPVLPTNFIGQGYYNNVSLCMMLDMPSYDVWNWVFLIVGELYIPSTVVSVFTGVIVFQLAKAYQNRSRMTSTRREQSQQTPLRSNKDESGNGSAASVKNTQPTVTLVVVAISFVIIRLPYTIMFYVNNNKSHLDEWTKFYIYGAYSLSMTLSIANYAINFFLYCLSGQQYRKQFISCVRCNKRPPSTSIIARYYSSGTPTTFKGMVVTSTHSGATVRLQKGSDMGMDGKKHLFGSRGEV